MGQQFAQFGGTELHKGASRRQVWPGHCPGATGDLRAVLMRLLSHGHLQEFSSPEPAEVTGGCPVLFSQPKRVCCLFHSSWLCDSLEVSLSNQQI